MRFPLRLFSQGRHAARHAAQNDARRGTTTPGHITVVRHVGNCAMYVCTCQMSGPLRATHEEARSDAEQHRAASPSE